MDYKKFLGIFIFIALIASPMLYLHSAHGTAWTGPEPTPTNLVLYLHNSSKGVPVGAVTYLNVLSTVNDTFSPWTNSGEVTTGMHYVSESFVVSPQLASSLVFNGTIYAGLYMNQTGSSPTGGSTTVYVYSVTADGQKSILGSYTNSNSLIPTGSKPSGTPVLLRGPTLNETVPTNDTVMVDINVTGSSSEHYGIWWGRVNGTYYQSSIFLPVSTYLTVSQVLVKNFSGQNVTLLPENVNNTTLTILATVEDPLGAYDFQEHQVDFSVLNTSGMVIFSSKMKPYPGLSPPYASGQTYILSYNYSSLVPGEYYFRVNSTDNTDHNYLNVSTSPSYFGRGASSSVLITVGLPPVSITAKVLDERGAVAVGADVRVSESGMLAAINTTNGTGEAGFMLSPGATYTFTVRWQQIVVGSFNETVSNVSRNFTLYAHIIYPTFSVRSPGGLPVPYALITLIHPNGSVFPLIVTSVNGTFALSQVPSGTYVISIIYDDTEILSSFPVNVTSGNVTTITVQDVYSLTIETKTVSGSPLPGVFVQAMNETTGAVIASGITESDGKLQFLVPAGSYVVTGSLVSTYDMTPVKQTNQQTIQVSSTKIDVITFTDAYPSFFATALFQIILVIVLLVAIIVFLSTMLIRNGGRQRRRFR